MKKIILQFLMAASVCSVVKAQVISRKIISDFPNSIVLQVYDFASKVKIDEVRQIVLAAHFVRVDSLMAAAISRGTTPQELASIKNGEADRLKIQIGSTTVDEYYNKCANINTEKEAKQTAAFLRRKYEGDSLMEATLYNLYHWQKTSLAKIHMKYDGTEQLDKELFSSIVNTDTAIENYTYSMKGNYILKGKLALLNNIKHLDTKTNEQLSNTYISLCKQKSGTSYADNFNEAMHRVIRDTAYYAGLYANEITQQANANTNRTLIHLINDNHVTKQGFDTVRYWAYAKERSLVTLNYAFPTYTKYKDSLLQLTLRRSDSLISIALMKDGTFPFTTLASTAIKMRQKLSLRAGEVDTLMGCAVSLQQMDDEYKKTWPLGKFDGSSYEAQHIPAVLSDDQYRLLLAEKNKAQSEKWSTEDWAEIKKRGLASAEDSITTIYELTAYNTNRLVAKDRYANDKVMQNAYINDIDNSMPAVMKKLKLARRTDNVANATKAANTNGQGKAAASNTFKW